MSVFVAVVGLVASAAFLACAHAVAKADELALEDEVPGAGHWINHAGTSFAGISLPVLQTIGSAALFTRFAWYVTETAYDAAHPSSCASSTLGTSSFRHGFGSACASSRTSLSTGRTGRMWWRWRWVAAASPSRCR